MIWKLATTLILFVLGVIGLHYVVKYLIIDNKTAFVGYVVMGLIAFGFYKFEKILFRDEWDSPTDHDEHLKRKEKQ